MLVSPKPMMLRGEAN